MKNFINKVKQILDNASWDYEACNPRGNYKDCEKACSYLETQKFSHEKVKKELSEIYDDFLYNARAARLSQEERYKLAAEMIADILAYDRISKYIYSGYRKDGFDSKKWHIEESVMFKIY